MPDRRLEAVSGSRGYRNHVREGWLSGSGRLARRCRDAAEYRRGLLAGEGPVRVKVVGIYAVDHAETGRFLDVCGIFAGLALGYLAAGIGLIEPRQYAIIGIDRGLRSVGGVDPSATEYIPREHSRTAFIISG